MLEKESLSFREYIEKVMDKIMQCLICFKIIWRNSVKEKRENQIGQEILIVVIGNGYMGLS